MKTEKTQRESDDPIWRGQVEPDVDMCPGIKAKIPGKDCSRPGVNFFGLTGDFP
ncbi:MAG TPA: hypothetical protein VKA70_14755 [Blastocatellia bacterium]|nr:hypothetical protein [Blastocatellia bacterium]